MTSSEVAAEIERLRDETRDLKAALASLDRWRIGPFWRPLVRHIKAELWDRAVAVDHLLPIYDRLRSEEQPRQ